MKYSAYGFPLPMIKFNEGNPTISLTGGQVSTLRNDDLGQLFMIQLDGSLQPGNSGGPIVDERGRLIGVAVAKLDGVDTIGLAIPADELRELLAGRVGAIDLEVRNCKTDQPEPPRQGPGGRSPRPDQGGQRCSLRRPRALRHSAAWRRKLAGDARRHASSSSSWTDIVATGDVKVARQESQSPRTSGC